MSRRIIVEMQPNAELAAASLAASAHVFGAMRHSMDREGVAAEVFASIAAATPLQPGFRVDPSFPPTPVPQPGFILNANEMTVEEGGLLRASPFDVRSAVKVDVRPEATPYIVRGVIDSDEQIAQLAQHPDVRAVYADPDIEPCIVCPGSQPLGTAADVATLLCTDKLSAAGMTGRGVLLAIVDTGINLDHLRAKGKQPSIDAAQSWEPVGTKTKAFAHPVNHGTMCAYDALIAAPDATLLDIAVLLSSAGPLPGGGALSGLLSDAVLAYSHLLKILQAPSSRPGQSVSLVVSNSWGVFSPASDLPVGNPGNYTDNPNHPFNRIVSTLEAFGADILFAAGNCGSDCADGRCAWRPGQSTIVGANSHPAVLSVAGVDVTGERVGYSSTGPGRLTGRKPDISGFTHFVGSGVYPADGGTSAACPVVAGVVAAVRSRLPVSASDGHSSPAAVRDLMCKTAKERGNPGYDYAYGWGIVNACRLSEVVPGIAPAPQPAASKTAIARLAKEMRGLPTSVAATSSFALADSGQTTTVVAHLVTGEDIESALITSSSQPDGVDFTGGPRDQTATITTDDGGMLLWGLSLETQFVSAKWTLTLTKKGGKEGDPDAGGLTNDAGKAVAGDVKFF